MIVRPMLALVLKDLRVFFADRHAVILSFAAPIALASFMAAVFGGAGESVPSRIPILMVDEDRGPVAASIVAGVRADSRLKADSVGRDAALAALRLGEVALVIVIPTGFGEAAAEALIGAGEAPELRYIEDPTRRPESSLAQGLLTRVVLEAVAAESLGDIGGDLIGDLAGSLGPPVEGQKAKVDDSINRVGFVSHSGRLATTRKGLTMPFVGRSESIVAGGAEGQRGALAAHAFAGMVVQFVLFSAVEWGVGLLLERERGLWKRLRMAPVSRGTLLGAKVIGSILASLLIMATVFGFGAVAFGIRVRGEFAGFVLISFAFAWMAANFGLMVAAVGRTPRGARSVAILAVLIMVMLGGGWIPGFLFPAWLQDVTPIIPARWAIDGFDGVFSRGFSLVEVARTAGALIGFGAAFGTLALASFRWAEPT